MSVTPDDPWELPNHRRPEAFGGSGPDPVWSIDGDELPPTLDYVQERRDHGLIAPATAMQLAAFREVLAGTRTSWSLV